MSDLEHPLMLLAASIDRHRKLDPLSLPFRPRDVAGWVPQHELRRLLRRGEVRRLRPGWYCLHTVDPVLATAVSAGGTATCVTALGLLGAWQILHPLPHVRLPADGRSPAPATVVAHRCGQRSHAVDDVASALRRAMHCQDREVATILADSVLNRGLMTQFEFDHLIAKVPDYVARKLRYADGASQSATETRVRLWLRLNQYPVVAQAYFPDVGHVDLLVGDHTVIECDSITHHTGENHFADRARDLALLSWGLRVIRLSYRQIMTTWEETQLYLRSLLVRRSRQRSRSFQRTPLPPLPELRGRWKPTPLK